MARRATITLDLETAQAQANLEDAQEELQQTEGAAEGTQQAFRTMSATVDRSGEEVRSMSLNASTGMARVAGASEEASSSVQKVGKSASSSATNLGFELVGAAQDAQFGIAGLANQIPLITEQFQRLRQRTGSTSSALSTLGGTFLGPAGIVGAITLGLPLVQQLASELFDAGDAAKEAGQGAAEADDQFRGLFETAQQLSQGLPNLESVASDLGDRFDDLRDPGITNFFGFAPGGGLEEQLRQIRAGRGVASSVRDIQEAIEGSSEEAKILREALSAADVDVGALLGDDIQAARTEIEQSADALRRLAEDPVQLIENPEVAADAIRRQFRDVSTELDEQFADNLVGEEEQINQRIQFLRERLRQASAQFDGIRDEEEFAPLLDELNRLRERLADLEEGQSGAADETERQEQAMNGLAVSAKQAAENMRTVRRTLNSMDQMPMQRRINAFGAGFQAPTVGGTMLRQGQSQGALMLQAARDAGFVEDFMDFSDLFQGERDTDTQVAQPEGLEAVSMSLQEIQREFGVSEDKARQFKRTANQQLGSVVNAAGQLGQSLVRAFSKGERSAKSIAATLLQGVGGVLSVIPGVGQIAGPVLGQLGGLIGAFEHGGVVDTPLQVVGEEGPELASLPQGTHISTARETEEILSSVTETNRESSSVTETNRESRNLSETDRSLLSINETERRLPVALSLFGRLGGLVRQFDEAGVVNSPLQIVGESGPELAALPQGTRISTSRETERMMSQQQVNVNVTGEIRRLRSRELGLILREDETRRNQFGYS